MAEQNAAPARCETCRWWVGARDGAGDPAMYQERRGVQRWFGDCHRHPPVVAKTASGGAFPGAFADDWCGEHQPRPEAPR